MLHDLFYLLLRIHNQEHQQSKIYYLSFNKKRLGHCHAGNKKNKINPNIIKISLENLIDEVKEKTALLQKEVDGIFEQIKKIQGNEYHYCEKFTISEDPPHFANEVDELDYIHETLIFKYSQLEIKLNTLKEECCKKMLQIEIKKLEMESTTLILNAFRIK